MSSAECRPRGEAAFAGLAVATCVLVYLQLVLGAVLRHVPVDSQPAAFMHAVRFHLFLAGVLVLHVLLLTWSCCDVFVRCGRCGG